MFGAVALLKILRDGMHFINYRTINIVKKQSLGKMKREGKLTNPENCFVFFQTILDQNTF